MRSASGSILARRPFWFLIPMRGSEFLIYAHPQSPSVAFLIPMRGSEPSSPRPTTIAREAKFLIPMRGSEVRLVMRDIEEQKSF